jgi:carbonic anhydrase
MSTKDIDDFIEGFKNFRDEWFMGESKQRFSHQKPKVLVIACSDSRVDPAILFGTDPGDVFVVRNVANLIPPFISDSGFHGVAAALEYAVKELEVQDIIILGHSHCGGIAALASTHDEGEFLHTWLNIAHGALLRVKIGEYADEDSFHRACEKESILVSLGNLLTYSWIKEKIELGSLAIHGWYFDLEHGRLYIWSPKEKQFIAISK